MHCSSKISYYLEKKVSFQMLSKSLHTCSFFHSTTCKGIPLFKIPWNDRVYLDLRLFCLVFLCICVVQCFIFFNIHVLCNVVVKKKKKIPKKFIAAWKVISPVCVYFVTRIAIILYAWNQLEVRVNSNVSTLM